VENESTSVIGGKESKKQLMMGVPICYVWHDIAQVGMHHRIGDKIMQDYDLSKRW
jgi:hypothetical protein